MTRSFAPTALLLGNFVIGTSIIGPSGMLSELSSGLGVSIRDAGLLITFGAVMLCICSPLSAWLTGRFDRRLLLGGIVLVLALSNFASAFAPSYAAVMAIRLVMMAIAAPFTPQAAGTVGLIVPEEKRGSVIAYVFLGWSLAAAIGLPLVTVIASRLGWQNAYLCIGLLSFIAFIMLVWRLPARVTGAPVDIKTWIALGRDPLVVLLLLVTCLQMAGQFVVFTFMAPLLQRLASAGPEAIAVVFSLYGIFGFVGNVVATRLVDTWGGYRTSLLFTTTLMIGVGIWAFGAGALLVMALGVSVWGLGFASSNSMQQVRLVGAAPPFAGASVSLNTSVLYVGQAVGSAIGGMLYVRDMLHATGFAALALVSAAVAVVLITRRLPVARS
ncbi:MAG: MFS transporter [Rhizobiales bacterium 62-47]|mgnify:CR=1 FL=1|nr:MFS transporter [Hyphomicrobiales bacterium]OJY08360.1 MAG: MFS transporter [Rhizobiales bacterium 62-47]